MSDTQKNNRFSFRNSGSKNSEDDNKEGKPKFNFYWIYLLLALVLLGLNFLPGNQAQSTDWMKIRDMLKEGDVKKFVVVNNQEALVFLNEEALNKDAYKDFSESPLLGGSSGPHYKYTIGSPTTFEEKVAKVEKQYNLEQEIPITYEHRTDWAGQLLNILIPIGLLVLLWVFIMRRISGGGAGGQLFNIGKSKAQLFDKDTKVKISFKDVAGLDEAKVEVMEVVDFLKNPDKYTKLGGKIPKGVLFVGPAGTGKTLLAKAVAGEAQVPFFSLSGSDFVEMFVGVGASRVRDLFKQAKEKAPCIIFIDEIDAVGKARGKNAMAGSNDERENTLNQLLTEMDGFATNSGVIIMGATNRPDTLDPALMRPGRFDRQISIDRPDIKGREAIFKVHLRNLRLANDVTPETLAEQTPGFAGAEIANICNEAALIAARNSKEKVDMADFQSAIDRVIGGLEKKNKIISSEEKEIVAWHEAGHAVSGWFLQHAAPLVKVSIVPRGVAALGYAQYLPKEQYLYTKEQLLDSMCMTLGGRAAEEVVFKRISTGAQNDLERVTKMSYDMISVYGMNKSIGQVSFRMDDNTMNLHKPYSEKTQEQIDAEARALIDNSYERTVKLLQERYEQLKNVAEALLERETIFTSDLERLLGKRKFDDQGNFIDNAERSEQPMREARQPDVQGDSRDNTETPTPEAHSTNSASGNKT
jgi:cell division protease FtsH